MDSDSKSHDHTDNKKNSCKVMSKVLLPQDLMLHIFHLLPIYCLVDSARYVSKHWAATFNQLDPRRLRSTTGIFVANPFSKGNSYFLEFKDDVNAGFETIYLPTPPNMGFLIGTCNGILMLSAPDGHVFLANPILKSWLRLPRFPISQSSIYIMNQCTITCVPRTAKFKLFFQDIVMVSDAPSYVFYVLTVGIDNSWKEIARKEAPLDCHISWKPLYSGGNDLYWITSEGIIVINVDEEIIVREYPLYLARHRRKPSYLWTGNHISCILTKRSYKAYEIHILDFDSGKWSFYHETGPFDYTTPCGHNLIAPEVKFRLWINDQIIFKIQYILFAYNVKTKQFTKIEDVDVDHYHEVWLHTNTLVSLSTTPT